MGERILNNIELMRESRCHVDCLHAILTAAGLFEGPKYIFSGMTALAFKFVAHKDLIPASTTMYRLDVSSRTAVDNLGIYSEIFSGVNFNPTMILYQKKAVERVKESIDRGIGVLVWAPKYMEFGVINGYDDEDRVFYYRDRIHKGDQVMLYSNLGENDSASWMIHIVGDSIEKDIRDIYLDSLEEAVDEWDIPFKSEKVMRKELASGDMAYEYILNALIRGEFHQSGACQIIWTAALSKKEIHMYMETVEKEFPEIRGASRKYGELVSIYDDICKIVPRPRRDAQIDRDKIPGLIEYIRAARKAEGEAVEIIRGFLKETLNNRYIDIFDVKKF